MLKSKLDQLKAKDGFTIIEVIIVLVIAAIIMLAVFLVVPQLQRTQRNTRRQNDARRVLAAAEQVAANAGGVYPTADAAGKTSIENITGTINSPAGSAYTWAYEQATTPDGTTIYYTSKTSTCSASNSPTAGASTKQVVIVAVEDSTGTNKNWCVGN